jgi:hypothetical protein
VRQADRDCAQLAAIIRLLGKFTESDSLDQVLHDIKLQAYTAQDAAALQSVEQAIFAGLRAIAGGRPQLMPLSIVKAGLDVRKVVSREN